MRFVFKKRSSAIGTLPNSLQKKPPLCEFGSGEKLITQDDDDNDVFFILCGTVRIAVHDREVARRHAGQHVGAEELQLAFKFDPVVVRVWSDDVFHASSFPLSDLERQLERRATTWCLSSGSSSARSGTREHS